MQKQSILKRDQSLIKPFISFILAMILAMNLSLFGN